MLLTLAAFPVVLYVFAGAFAIWKVGWMQSVWWIAPVFWAVTWVLARVWPTRSTMDQIAPDAGHFSSRDQSAAEIVLQYQQDVGNFTPTQLTDFNFYVQQFQSLSTALARHYHPNSPDPYSSLTVPELAAALRLVADDIEDIALNSIPGSRKLTVKQWRTLGKAPAWAQRLQNAVWAGSFLINPFNIARYGLSRMTVDKVGSNIQSEVIAGVYVRFIRQVGFYLIEMNSGRLRGGAELYRAAFEKRRGSEQPVGGAQSTGASDGVTGISTQMPAGSPSAQSPSRPGLPHTDVTIGLIGQVSAGKSSLINCLCGNNAAAVDMLPETSAVKRYVMQVESTDADHPAEVVLLDSPGYGVDGLEQGQADEIQKAIESSDILLLVLDGHQPGKEPDLAVLRQVREYYARHPALRPPPVIAVMTHIDLIPPAMQWNPPPHLKSPQTRQDVNIVDALAYTEELFLASGEGAAASAAGSQDRLRVLQVVPVCGGEASRRPWGVREHLLPAILSQLSDGQSVAMLAAFEDMLDRDWMSTVFQQLKTGGKQLLNIWIDEKRKQLKSKKDKL